MIFKRISIEDTIKFTDENEQEIREIVSQYAEEVIPDRLEVKEKYLKEIVMALALCHNVTPVYNEEEDEKTENTEGVMKEKIEEISTYKKVKDFQASSPD